MITVSHLFYDYPGLRALDDISFKLSKCSITALVGPNGAGKTTLLRSLAALDAPLSGDIEINGVNVWENPRQAHLYIGYLPDHFGLYHELTAWQCIVYAAWSRGLRGGSAQQAAHWAVEQVGLEKQLSQFAGTLSRGQRQRLALAQAIVHKPKVLIMDEPASGLDPQARSDLSGLMKRLAAQGMTLLVSSHILSELETYCTGILVLEHGRLLAHQTLSEAQALDNKQKVDRSIVEIRIGLVDRGKLPELAQWFEILAHKTRVSEDGALYLCGQFDDVLQRHQLLAQAIHAGWQVTEFTPIQKTFQDVYLQAISQQANLHNHTDR